MPIIPRYQARGGPRTEGLDYAGAYQAPGGGDWRMLARAADAAGSVLSALPRPKPKDAPPVGPAEGRTGVNAADHLLAQEGEVRWRRRQLEMQSRADRGGIEEVSRSRQEAANALPPGARGVFDRMTVGREAGFAAAAAAQAAARVREASEALSAERQALGLDEYQALIDTAPEQAKAALGSAVGELGARLRDSGAAEAEIQAAQKALVSASEAERVRRVLHSDPERARALLDQSHLVEAVERETLAAEMEAEHLRLGVRREVGRWVGEDPSLAADQDRLLALADQAGEGDTALTGLYRGAALSAWRNGQAQADARRARAWEPIEQRLADGRVQSWTDLTTAEWRGLEPDQQGEFRRRTEQGWGGEAGLVPVGLLDDFELTPQPPFVRRKPPPPPPPPTRAPRLPPRAVIKQQSEIAEDEVKGRSGTLDPVSQAQFDKRHENRQILAGSPEVRAFMSVIAWAEGNVSYNTLGGDRQGKVYSRSLSTGHPGRVSGRYQIDTTTWQEFGEKKLGLTDYSDHAQDLAGIQIMKEKGVLEALQSGDVRLASDRAAERWAPFREAGTEHSKFVKKGTKEYQPSKSRDEVVARYEMELAKEKAKDAERARRLEAGKIRT